jgi:hypothetical protein
MSVHTTRRFFDGRWMKIPKVKFGTPEDASQARERMVESGIDAVLNVYQCPLCNFWHVGKARTKRPRIKGMPKLTGNDARDRYNLLSTLYRRIRYYAERLDMTPAPELSFSCPHEKCSAKIGQGCTYPNGNAKVGFHIQRQHLVASRLK